MRKIRMIVCNAGPVLLLEPTQTPYNLWAISALPAQVLCPRSPNRRHPPGYLNAVDLTEKRSGPGGRSGAEKTALAFAAFVLAHEDCAGEMAEARLDDETLACRCLPCDEVRVFRSGEASPGWGP